MQSLILGLAHDPEALTIGAHRGSSIAVEGDVIDTFDQDGPLVEGTAAGYVDRTKEVPIVQEEAIFTEERTDREHVAVDFTADCGAGYVGVDSSDGAFLWDWLGAQCGTLIERARIDVDALADRLRELDSAVWQVGYSREGGDDEADEVGVRYHADADLADARESTQLGFAADFPSGYVKGTVASSGFVAAYEYGTTEQVAVWLREEILFRASLPTDEQTELPGGEA